MANQPAKITDGVTVAAWLDRETYAKLKRLADKQEHTVSHLVRKAVKLLVEKGAA